MIVHLSWRACSAREIVVMFQVHSERASEIYDRRVIARSIFKTAGGCNADKSVSPSMTTVPLRGLPLFGVLPKTVVPIDFGKLITEFCCRRKSRVFVLLTKLHLLGNQFCRTWCVMIQTTVLKLMITNDYINFLNTNGRIHDQNGLP